MNNGSLYRYKIEMANDFKNDAIFRKTKTTKMLAIYKVYVKKNY